MFRVDFQCSPDLSVFSRLKYLLRGWNNSQNCLVYNIKWEINLDQEKLYNPTFRFPIPSLCTTDFREVQKQWCSSAVSCSGLTTLFLTSSFSNPSSFCASSPFERHVEVVLFFSGCSVSVPMGLVQVVLQGSRFEHMKDHVRTYN